MLRFVDESSRIENVRSKKLVRLPIKISDVRRHFDENLKDVKDKYSLAQNELKTNLRSAEEIWRSQVVFLESALDFYIHELVKYGLLKIFNGEWPETDKSKKFKVSFPIMLKLYRNPENAESLLGEEIDTVNRENCFLGFEYMQANLGIVGLKADSKQKSFIDGLYRRRNQIAHQSDRRPNSAEKIPIKEQDVKDYIEKVLAFARSIDRQVKEKNRR